MNQIWWLLLAFSLAVTLDLYFIGAWRRYRQLKQDYGNAGIPISRWKLWKQVIISKKIRLIFASIWQRIWINQRFHGSYQVVIELVLIAIWSMYVGKTFLNFDPLVIPAGREFNSAIQTHHLWTQFQKCGWCAVWNGSVKGGFPAF